MFELPSKSTCYIGGAWVSVTERPRISIYNPSNGQIVGQVPNCNESECIKAIESGQSGYQTWSRLPPDERAYTLNKIASLIRREREALAKLITVEQGKPLKESLGEVSYGEAYFEWFAEEAKRIYGDVIPTLKGRSRSLIIKQPIGLCAAITPWNFPHAMIARKVAAALAAGCSIIVKPAPETPLSALALAAISQEAGLPTGVLNVITGDAEPIARTLMNSPIVRKITFTGSTAVGKILIAQSASTVKRLTMELGGNAPFIVFEDANIELALKDAIFAKFRNAGQTCICTNRFIVHKKIVSKFTDSFIKLVKELKIGDGLDPETEIGPLISEEACLKAESLIHDAISNGATTLLKGERVKGLFVSPSVINGVNDNMRIWNEEIFGPIAVIATFEDDDEALSLANNTESGLAAYFYTSNMRRVFDFSEKLEYGMVGVNNAAISAVEIPFGGIKQSGYGREGSKYGIDDYLNIKYISINAD